MVFFQYLYISNILAGIIDYCDNRVGKLHIYEPPRYGQIFELIEGNQR